MSTLAWNCRGVGNPWTVLDLCSLVAAHSPKMVFLSETWQQKKRMKNLVWRIALKKCFVVESEDQGGSHPLLG
jgi:hypothetical protein